MSELNLKFTSSPGVDTGSYRLLELPPELLKIIESDSNASLVIKGTQNEDAVLCTREKTYTVRSVVLSNSVLVVTSPLDVLEDAGEDIVIRDTIHEVLEVVPTLPRLQRLTGMLRGREYDEGHEEDEDVDMEEEEGRASKRRRFTYEDARDMLQASDLELARGLRERRILLLNGELRPLARSYLTAILEFLLTALIANSFSHESAPEEELVSVLEHEHEVRRDVARQVMVWFGELRGGRWKMDVDATVKEVGLGILKAYRDDPIPESDFLTKWRTAVGDTFASAVDLKLLLGNFLANPAPFTQAPLISYFPASELPADPASRFADLFLTRPRWKADEITPFLADIVVDNKERDRLLLKYARAITDKAGVWYTARAKLV
ncbi:sister chromatid cohesion protein Dcc1 [Phanerochaete sordida]|uniref:Sister chromatid cohesion protein Dcc1 n=1 Tax=Phanerochaete sordida TaxID=48140 RepID=A0A9P3LIN5_9APHY|nr:sister chromatid cohesion protein Dcc1 [Phanerochaete sordida]